MSSTLPPIDSLQKYLGRVTYTATDEDYKYLDETAKNMVGKPRARGRNQEQLSRNVEAMMMEKALCQMVPSLIWTGPEYDRLPYDCIDQETGLRIDVKTLRTEFYNITLPRLDYLIKNRNQIDALVLGSYEREGDDFHCHFKTAFFRRALIRSNPHPARSGYQAYFGKHMKESVFSRENYGYFEHRSALEAGVCVISPDAGMKESTR